MGIMHHSDIHELLHNLYASRPNETPEDRSWHARIITDWMRDHGYDAHADIINNHEHRLSKFTDSSARGGVVRGPLDQGYYGPQHALILEKSKYGGPPGVVLHMPVTQVKGVYNHLTRKPFTPVFTFIARTPSDQSAEHLYNAAKEESI